MKTPVYKVAIFGLIVTLTSTSLVYAAVKSVPLDSKKVVTYISRILANPTDSTDGTVKKAVSLTQSCKQGEVMQGFSATGGLICTQQVKTNDQSVNPAKTQASETKKSANANWNFGCVTIEDSSGNETKSFTMFCNARSGKICFYSSINDPSNGRWTCDSPKGFDVNPTEYINCTGNMMRFNQQVTYNLYCTSDQWKFCSYWTVADTNGKINPSEWKCGKVSNPEIMAEFQ